MTKDKATVLGGGIALQASGLPDIASGEVPEWIHILPAGEAQTVDGRGPYSISNPDAVIEASMQEAGGKIVVDENHSTDIAGKSGMPARASGWVTELQSRSDGIWAKVDWTKDGKELVSSQSYRGISPVIIHDDANRVLRILRVSLTNKPNLRGMVALHTQNQPETETIMDLSALIELLGLDQGTTEEDVTAAIKKLADTKEPDGDEAAMQSALSDIAKKLGKGVKAETTAICSALDVVLDPKSNVPMASFVAVQTELAEIKSTLGRDKAEAAVDAAIKAGKPGVKPSREYFISLHMQNPAGTEEMLGKMAGIGGTIVNGAPAPHSTDKNGLSGSDREAAAALGIDHEAYAKTLAANAAKQEAL